MVSSRLLLLIEMHADTLARNLLEKVEYSDSTRSFNKVSREELERRVREIYEHLGAWLLERTDADLERHYRQIGARRYRQGVPLAELVWAIMLAKHNLWEFLSWESVPERPSEVVGELDLLLLVGNFFDRAIHYAVLGYEQERAEELQAELVAADAT